MSKKSNKTSLFQSGNVVNIITIIVVTLASVVLVLFLAKGLFSSNDKDVPAGLNTATIANGASPAAATLPASSTTTASTAASSIQSVITDHAAVSETTTTTTVTTAAPDDSVGYIVTYVQLKSKPDQTSENLICMSPNLKVKILERRNDDYIYLSFLNGDGKTYAGYVKKEYISPTEVERTTASSTAAGEIPAGQETPAVTTTTAASYRPLIETPASTQTTPQEMTFPSAPQ